MTTPVRPRQPRVRADEGVLHAASHDAVHEVLRESMVDLRHVRGGAFGPVAARVVDVGVEPVLVRAVPEPAVARSERPSMRPAQIADEQPGSGRMRAMPLGAELLDEVDQAIGAEAPPPAVRRAVEDGVPGHEAHARGR